MYLLSFLRSANADPTEKRTGGTTVEYRLVCSGVLYDCTVETCDWHRSDVTRVLLRSPFELFDVSRRFHTYPQELALRFTAEYVTEVSGNFSSHFLPDEDIVEDLCAMLTLLSRRLIAPVVKLRETSAYECAALGSFGSDVPLPLLPVSRFPMWSRRPLSIITSPEGRRVVSHDPPPVGVDPSALQKLLLKLPESRQAALLLNAARLYKTAMELIETRPDISYQLLISTVESLANAALKDYQPSESEMVEAKKSVFQRAREFGLEEDKARQLALDACRGDRWLSRKFRQFLSTYASSREIWARDRLFIVTENLCPQPEDFDSVLGRIYRIRSRNLHAGSPFPRHVGLGTAPSYPARDLPLDPLATPDVPPVPWFERVVSVASQRFIQEQTSAASTPFLHHDTEPSGCQAGCQTGGKEGQPNGK